MKGILFTEILFNKTIRKGKTMTRRVPASLKVINENPDAYRLVGYNDYGSAIFDCDDEDFSILVVPTYKFGEVVYIKEPWAAIYYDESGGGDIVYKYDFAESERHLHKWSNKLFTGADKARHYIKITDVRVERLFDISNEDCLKEGIDMLGGYEAIGGYKDYQNKSSHLNSPQESFFSLFRFANRVPKSKEIPNIWCFVYEYVLCDKEGHEIFYVNYKENNERVKREKDKFIFNELFGDK